MNQSPIPTPHIEAQKSDIAKTVLMPGDPLRAKFIAETFLENPVCFNHVRGMLGYTGEYQGHRVSVMGSGMGMPSIGIYSYELYKFYDVDHIIRVGSCGSYSKDLNVYDVILCEQAYSESTFAQCQHGHEGPFIDPSEHINQTVINVANEQAIELHLAKIHSSDVFYREKAQAEQLMKQVNELNVKAVEMESFALFANAKILNKHAACILTVSDSLVTGAVTTSEERQKSFTKMMKLGLESAIRL